MNIRQFRYTDLDAVIHIAQLSFADEYRARGESPDSFSRQIRMAARARMIPFRLLTAFSGINWGLFVAEKGGEVVGFSSYLGRETVELANLMVHPDYRRQGIGNALLEMRLQALSRLGYPFVTTTILASNHASLANVEKQGFKVFERLTVLEAPLPLEDKQAKHNLISRSIQKSDKVVFLQIENQLSNLAWRHIQKSAELNYFHSVGNRLMNRLTNTQYWIRVFTNNETIVGFLLVNTSPDQAKGMLSRPMILDENIEHLPAMLNEAALHLTHLGKSTVQIGVPDERHKIIESIQNGGWVKIHTWVRLIKKLVN